MQDRREKGMQIQEIFVHIYEQEQASDLFFF